MREWWQFLGRPSDRSFCENRVNCIRQCFQVCFRAVGFWLLLFAVFSCCLKSFPCNNILMRVFLQEVQFVALFFFSNVLLQNISPSAEANAGCK